MDGMLIRGGTILGTSRTNPFKDPALVKQTIDNITTMKLDALIADPPELLDLAVAIEEGAGDRAAAERYRTRLREGFPDYTPTAREGSPQS